MVLHPGVPTLVDQQGPAAAGQAAHLQDGKVRQEEGIYQTTNA